MSRENCERLLACVRKRFADVVEFADSIEDLQEQARRLDREGDEVGARGTRRAIELACEAQLLAGEQFRVEFRRLRDATIYSEFAFDEWAEISDLNATEKELARRLAEREFRHREE